MSKIVEVKAEINDLLALHAAVQRLGGTMVEVDQIHEISFQGSYYKVRVQQENGAYKLVYDNMLERVIGPKAGLLMQAYGLEKSYGEAIARGYVVVESKEPNGEYVLEIEI